MDGLPLGTRGGMKFRHNFPADGEYRFTIVDLGIDLYSRVLDSRHTVVILVDGREVFRGDARRHATTCAPWTARARRAAPRSRTGSPTCPVQVKAGTYDVAVTFIERARVAVGRVRRLPAGRRVQPRRSRAAPGRRREGGRPVQLARRVGHAEPPQDLRLPARRQDAGARVRPAHRRHSGARRVPPSGHRAGRRRPDAVLRQGTRERLRRRRRAVDRGGARQPGVPVSDDSYAGGGSKTRSPSDPGRV